MNTGDKYKLFNLIVYKIFWIHLVVEFFSKLCPESNRLEIDNVNFRRND